MDIEDETVENEEMDAEYEDMDSDSANQNNINISETGESSKEKVARKVYLPGQSLQSDEELVCDESAYIMLHQAKTGAPCLSFDIISDSLGNNRDTFPMTSYLVAGTQGEGKNLNHIIVIKMSNLFKTQKTEKEEESSDSESDSDDSSDTAAPRKTPRLDCTLLPHKGCINRVRASTIGSMVLTASWSELGVVNIWDVTDNLRKLGTLRPSDPVLLERIGLRDQPKPLHSFKGHQGEGFAVDWCNTVPGMLATGDCARNIHIWTPKESAAGWIVNQVPLKGHTASVEDVQWSPNEKHVLASCSVDCSIRIWDTRVSPVKANKLTIPQAHEGDVNVIHWNLNEPMIVSGGDDGKVHIWDIRQFKSPIATFKHHGAPITTVEWHPSESSVFASGGADDQISLWDLAVERDAADTESELAHLPPQLLFIHQGQKEIKELHWHPQIPGLVFSTANSGFNVFKTISV